MHVPPCHQGSHAVRGTLLCDATDSSCGADTRSKERHRTSVIRCSCMLRPLKWASLSVSARVSGVSVWIPQSLGLSQALPLPPFLSDGATLVSGRVASSSAGADNSATDAARVASIYERLHRLHQEIQAKKAAEREVRRTPLHPSHAQLRRVAQDVLVVLCHWLVYRVMGRGFHMVFWIFSCHPERFA